MSLNASQLAFLADKGMTLAEVVELARLGEVRRDATNADRQARFRSKRSNALRNAVTPPNEYISNPPVSPSPDGDAPPIADRVVEAWNGMAAKAGLAISRKLNPKRRSSLTARIAEHGEPAVFEAIANIGRSEFHCGGNDRHWKADLGWLLTSPEKFQKILEMPAPDTNPRQVWPPPNGNLDAMIAQTAKRYPPKDQAA